MIDNVLIFDIETVADTEAYCLLHHLNDMEDEDVYRLMCSERLAENDTTFFRHYLHKIVAISVVWQKSNQFKVWSLGTANSDERELIERFFHGIEKYSPTLVSWNGGSFDLPVLHYRALFHGINARRYFEIGSRDSDFKFNNYQNRFHWRHIDLMDVLSGFQLRAVAPLDDIARLCGFPGKTDMDGSAVQSYYYRNDIAAIRRYCETDVLNTCLVYLRFELMRGNLSLTDYEQSIKELKHFLAHQEDEHFKKFLQIWESLEK